ncbi:serine hydrolase [Emticicia sp. CRIBPO]|uniref:serine hydrolase n=1 Tax=Emticicia sp. CRIBPO TaxID=2683258 RepID=UPI001412EA49|nr:serine hydrolase [Emticicia sp. CRIBPO]NBA85734.1 serine hydrolase [Emticicia sp. CRIBPO]
MKKIPYLFILLFYSQLLFAQSKESVKFDQLLDEKFGKAPSGATALVAKNGQIIYKKALGKANIELDIPMKTDHVFRIGSITKQFTAVAILQLMEQGKLSLQDEITKFLPDYPTQGHKITIEHLLTHTSGIKSYTGMKEFMDLMRKDMEPQELINVFKDQPMEFTPGTKWKYNNSGYFLLGYIIEKVSGKTYPEYLEEVFFKPLGMTNSYYGDNDRIIRNRASGYDPGENGVNNSAFLSMKLPYAAGSIMSTVEDLFKWNKAVHAYKLVKKETLQQAFKKYRLVDGKDTSYGYGWSLSDIQGSPTIEHGGGINGFLTNGIYLPQEDVFVAVFSNSTGVSPDDVSIRIAAAAIGKPYENKEISVSESVLKGYEGVFVNEEGAKRTITFEDKKLYSQRAGNPKFRIKAYEKDKFFFDDAFTKLEFRYDDKGKVNKVISTDRGSQTVWNLTNESTAAPAEIKVEEEVLKTYAGGYELAPGFVLTITSEGSRLFGQATGQGKNELFAESPTKFFLKVVDAKVEFFKDAAGKTEKLILYQGGRQMEGKKVK